LSKAFAHARRDRHTAIAGRRGGDDQCGIGAARQRRGKQASRATNRGRLALTGAVARRGGVRGLCFCVARAEREKQAESSKNGT
jgi:hypothetical protein